MNSTYPEPNSQAHDEAALWAAKIDGSTLESSDRAALDQWLAANPNHRVLLSQYCQFSADLEQQLPLVIAAGGVKLPAETPSIRPRTSRVLWLAGSLAAAAAVVGGVWISRPTLETRTVATSVAERQSVRLADGSLVELNARTNLRVDFSAKERHVRMADGQAFFTVAKDKSRPFVIDTPAGSVRVTGTIFDVHADSPADFAVTVLEGSVQVNPGQSPQGHSPGPVALRSNDQLVVSDGRCDVRHLDASDVEDTLAWRHGEVVFNGTPLAAAVAKFARYHGRTVTVAAPIANVTVGGRFKLDDLDGFLNAIEAFLPVQVSPQSSGAIAVTPRTGS